ncbi:unnamed protein product [Ilex paraguariensis]|uniref:Exostosin GT47 domain-containing protein n=1 Tax=Ilex paraguariensis TaxID=185542 RepID=A0ABC8TMU4_9AQUA
MKARISVHPYLCLFTSFLFIQALVFLITHTAPPSLPIRTFNPPPVAAVLSPDECRSGKVYVYDLPPMFNKDLLASCDDLDPWNWQCGIISNDGYGRRATEFAGILPGNLATTSYRTNQFSSEVIFHYRLLNYKCTTLDPESATAFYIPFYAGLAVGKNLWRNDTKMRDWHCEMMLRWVLNQTYYQRANGSDHFITLSRITWDFRRLTDPLKLWGSSFLNMPLMQNVTRFTIEKAPGDDYDVGVPYPTGFHPSSDSDVVQWQSFVRNRNRSSLFTFIGAARGSIENDFRAFLLSYCYNDSDSCRVVDCAVTQCSNGTSAILEALLDSKFCLQPKGDSYTRRSVFDCMVAGSVPVFFWKRTAYDQYDWFLPGEPESWSVFIDHEDVRNGTSIRDVLQRYSGEEVGRMREKVIESIPRIVYARPGKGLEGFRDAFDIAVEGVLRRFKEQKEGRGVYAGEVGVRR